MIGPLTKVPPPFKEGDSVLLLTLFDVLFEYIRLDIGIDLLDLHQDLLHSLILLDHSPLKPHKYLSLPDAFKYL